MQSSLTNGKQSTPFPRAGNTPWIGDARLPSRLSPSTITLNTFLFQSSTSCLASISMDQFKEYPPTSRGCTHQVDDSTCSPAWTSLPQVSPRAYNKSTSLLGLPRKGLVEVLSRFHQGQWRTIASLAMPQLLFCSSPLCLSVCPFSLPPWSRKGGLFVHVLTRRAWGVSFGVHYIAILVDSPLRNFFDLQTKSQNGWGRLGMHLVCFQEVYSQVWACSGL